MTFGALTVNDAGRVQIDGELPNYYVVQSGSAASNVAIPRPDPSQIIFVRPHTTPGTIHISTTVGPSGPDFSVTSSTGYFEYVFVKIFETSYTSGNNGLKIFSGTGALCFDSNAPQFNFAMGTEIPLAPTIETTISIPNPALKKIYISFSTLQICLFRAVNGSLGRGYGPVQVFDSEVIVRSKVASLPGIAPPMDLGPFSATRPALFLYKQE